MCSVRFHVLDVLSTVLTGPDATEMETEAPTFEDKTSLYVLATTLCAAIDEITSFRMDGRCA
jgi:hypothetical protein